MILATKPTKRHETMFLLLFDLVVFVADNTPYMKPHFISWDLYHFSLCIL